MGERTGTGDHGWETRIETWDGIHGWETMDGRLEMGDKGYETMDGHHGGRSGVEVQG